MVFNFLLSVRFLGVASWLSQGPIGSLLSKHTLRLALEREEGTVGYFCWQMGNVRAAIQMTGQ